MFDKTKIYLYIYKKVNRNSYEGSTRKSGVESAFLTGAFCRGSGHSVMMRVPLMMIISYLRSDVYV
ncbi:hypothetical protein DP091_02000 [Paenibacillus sp. MDMC362]|nr:hypothetical protein DP091_02000 [Paenibacillus sp. MDMC362]